jgi:outer membrane lipoprotein SlyB
MNEVQATTSHRRTPSAAALIGGAVLLASLGAAAGWMMRSAAPAPAQPVAALSSEPTLPPPPNRAVERNSAVRTLPAPVHSARNDEPGRYAGEESRPLPTSRVAQCHSCGTVEGVRTVQRKAPEGSGVGAVAGGVLGGVVGNQIGNGSGRSVATVLGVIGGGLAGNEVEKRVRTTTVYEVRVRMDDGSVRTLTQSAAPALGSRVTVDGSTLRSASTGGDPALMRTVDNGRGA